MGSHVWVGIIMMKITEADPCVNILHHTKLMVTHNINALHKPEAQFHVICVNVLWHAKAMHIQLPDGIKTSKYMCFNHINSITLNYFLIFIYMYIYS